jgi:hypothetical protein
MHTTDDTKQRGVYTCSAQHHTVAAYLYSTAWCVMFSSEVKPRQRAQGKPMIARYKQVMTGMCCVIDATVDAVVVCKRSLNACVNVVACRSEPCFKAYRVYI